MLEPMPFYMLKLVENYMYAQYIFYDQVSSQVYLEITFTSVALISLMVHSKEDTIYRKPISYTNQ